MCLSSSIIKIVSHSEFKFGQVLLQLIVKYWEFPKLRFLSCGINTMLPHMRPESLGD